MKEKCKTCRFFKRNSFPKYAKMGMGNCFRRSPTLDGWPFIDSKAWCGEYEKKQEDSE